MDPIDRRTFLAASSLLPLAAALPRGALARAASARGHRVLTAHEAMVVVEATARLIPGPSDDPAEAGHPGAREAGVVQYIDTMLGALGQSPPRVFAGGPFSNRSGSAPDDMARFLALDRVERAAWRTRLGDLTARYRAGVRALDAAAAGDFAGASHEQQDAVLSTDPGGFTTLLMQHAIEGMYSNPEYGGNRGLVGWQDIGFPGDSQPRGYAANAVSTSDGPDPLDLTPTVQAALALLAATAPPG